MLEIRWSARFSIEGKICDGVFIDKRRIPSQELGREKDGVGNAQFVDRAIEFPSFMLVSADIYVALVIDGAGIVTCEIEAMVHIHVVFRIVGRFVVRTYERQMMPLPVVYDGGALTARCRRLCVEPHEQFAVGQQAYLPCLVQEASGVHHSDNRSNGAESAADRADEAFDGEVGQGNLISVCKD